MKKALLTTDRYATRFSSFVESDFDKERFNDVELIDANFPHEDAENAPNPCDNSELDCIKHLILCEKPANVPSTNGAIIFPLGSSTKGDYLQNYLYDKGHINVSSTLISNGTFNSIKEYGNGYYDRPGFSWDGMFSSSGKVTNLMVVNGSNWNSNVTYFHTIFNTNDGMMIDPKGSDSNFSYEFTAENDGYYCFSFYVRREDESESELSRKYCGKYLLLSQPKFDGESGTLILSDNLGLDNDGNIIVNTDLGRISVVKELSAGEHTISFGRASKNPISVLKTCGYQLTKSNTPLEYDPRTAGYFGDTLKDEKYPLAFSVNFGSTDNIELGDSWTVHYRRLIHGKSGLGSYCDCIGNLKFGHDDEEFFYQIGDGEEISFERKFNQFEQITVICDKGKISILIDGEEVVSELTGFKDESVNIGEVDCNILLGCEIVDGIYTYYSGKYSELIIYPKALVESEIKMLDDSYMSIGCCEYRDEYYEGDAEVKGNKEASVLRSSLFIESSSKEFKI